MKKTIFTLLAAAMVVAAVPAFAQEHEHDATHKVMDDQCTRECAMLIKDCNLEVDSIQDRIKNLQVEINEKGANSYTLEELKTLNKKLKESNNLLEYLNKPH